ncbi:MAG: phosphoribosyltransferase family protein [Candidatus Eisenbacteria bacterium]
MRYLKSTLREIGLTGRSVFSVLVPQLCVACDSVMADSSRQWLCRSCAEEFAGGAGARSRVVELADGQGLRVRYALDYSARVAKVIAEMKYGDKPGLAALLASYLCVALGTFFPEDAMLVPVPMHPAKKRERGYNQSELLSKRLSRTRGPGSRSDLIVKTRNTTAQAALEKEAREKNVAGSFAVRPGTTPDGRNVVLVDDVVTTGSTLRACAEAIRGIGVGEISACVVASSV